jgi:hypothetical protein
MVLFIDRYSLSFGITSNMAFDHLIFSFFLIYGEEAGTQSSIKGYYRSYTHVNDFLYKKWLLVLSYSLPKLTKSKKELLLTNCFQMIN